MAAESAAPLSRLVDVDRLSPEGADVVVETTPEERAALAQDFALPGVPALQGRFRLRPTAAGVHVSGQVTGIATQTCVVTLEPFDSPIEEDVDLDFAAADAVGSGPAARAAAAQAAAMPGGAAEPRGGDSDYDPPDEIVNGRIDIGALTAEFFALGLDPYPRKPGAAFSFEAGEGAEDSPFAALSKLKGDG